MPLAAFRYLKLVLVVACGLVPLAGCHDAQLAWEDTKNNMRGFRTYSEPTYYGKVERMIAEQEPSPRYADSVFGNYRTPATVSEGETEVYPLRPPPKTYQKSVVMHQPVGGRTNASAGWARDTAGGGVTAPTISRASSIAAEPLSDNSGVEIIPLDGPNAGPMQLTP